MRRPVLRSVLVLGVALAALVIYGWLAVRVYRGQVDPEASLSGEGAFSWIVGPQAKALVKAADLHIDRGLAALNDTAKAPALRLAGYRDELRAAERLLLRSLKAQPAQPGALARLAAVRWDLDPPVEEEKVRKHLELIDAAGRLAPQVPDVQLQLGELLLRMGRRSEAAAYLGRAVRLDPSTSAKAVRVLRESAMSAEEIGALLPRSPAVLIAVQNAYFEDDKGEAYIALVEAALPAAPADLIAHYGRACLRSGQSRRLREGLDRMGVRADPRTEAERLRQRSAALTAMGEAEPAVADARRARDLAPEDPSFADHLGRTLSAAGKTDEAVAAFREALALLARGSGDRGYRARIYAEIGQVEEKRGQPARAYDAYARAVELDPEQPLAARRLRDMKKAAGTDPEPSP